MTTIESVETTLARNIAAEHAVEADRQRRLAHEVVAALVDAGLARHFVPERHGGNAGTFVEAAELVADIAQGCTSAAWCGLIYATSARMAGCLPAGGQHDVWADGPDTLISAGLVPGGTAIPNGTGWILGGNWKPLSGADFAGWALLCARTPEGGPAFFAVPRRDLRIQDTWDTVGMRGSGSQTVVVQNVFVPAERMVPQAAVLRGSADPAAATCHRVPLLAVGPTLFVTPVLGAARAALADWNAGVVRRDAGSAAQAFANRVLADTSAEIDAAELLTMRASAMADRGAVPAGLAARSARDASYAAGLLRTAVDRLFAAGGGAAQETAHALQRRWRDVHCATGHAALRPDRAADLYAAAVWG